MNTDFAKAFRVIRAAYGYQQAELANRIDISASQLSLDQGMLPLEPT